jgi:transposase
LRRQKSVFAAPPWTEESKDWQRLDEQLPANHRARWLEQYIDSQDLSALEESYWGVGSEAYRPDLFLKIALYEILEGRRSPAQWARDVKENIILQWLGRGIQPCRTALYNFRDRLADTIGDVHKGMVHQAVREGLMDPREGVLDGTATRACASRHRVVNRSVLERRRGELQAALELDQAGQPPAAVPGWMAKTAGGRQKQSQRFAKAQAVLDQRLQANGQRPKDKRLAENKVTVSTSDPEAVMGRDKEKTFCPLYTSQFVVEPDSLVILAFEVFAQATDAGTLGPMLDKTAEVIGRQLDAMTTDAGYVSVLDLQECKDRGVELFGPVQENDFTEKKRAAHTESRIEREQFTWLPEEAVYLCPEGHRLNYKGQERKRRRGNQEIVQYRYQCPPEHCRSCPLRDRCVRDPEKGRTIKRLEGQELLDAQRAKMKTTEGASKRKRRGQVIERAFADAKEHRNLRKFHGRGLERARAEVGLVVVAQTALTIHRLRENHSNAGKNSS